VGLRAQDDYFRARVLAYVRDDPAGFLAGLAHKAAQYANGREVPRNTDLYVLREWSPLLGALAWKAGRFGFPWGLFFPLALVGLWLGRRRWPAPLWVLAATQPLLLVLVFVAGRHRVPLVPLLAVPAALSCVAIAGAVRTRRWRPALALGAAVAVLAALASLPAPSCEERLDYRAELFALLARQTLNDGDLDATEALLREALRTSPASPDANFRMGRVWLARGEPARALFFLDTALAAGPEPLALAQRCRARLALGDAGEARADCETALRLRPAERLAELFLGDVERAEGKPDAARARWQSLAGGNDDVAARARARLAALAREGR
jgi:tetratricopeptide (TPR) repeat protein